MNMRTLSLFLAVVLCPVLHSPMYAQPAENGPETPAKPTAGRPAGTRLRIGGAGENARRSRGVYILAFSPDDSRLASRHSDHVVRVWDLPGGKAKFECDGHEGYVKALAYSHDGKQIFTGATGDNEVVQVWNADDGSKLHQMKGGAAIVQVLPKGDQIAVADTGRFEHFLIESGRPLVKYSGAKFPLAVSRDGRVHAGVNRTDSKNINIFRPFTSSVGLLKGLIAPPGGGRFSPDGKLFAALARREKQVLLWDVDSRGGARFKLEGHAGAVQSLAFSRDNRFLATGGWDHTVCLWEVLTGRLAAKLEGHAATVCAVAFSHYGFTLASGASGRNDNSILLWDLKHTLFKPSLQPAEITAIGAREIWSQLGGEDAIAAMRIAGSLAAAPEIALPLLQEGLDASIRAGDDAAVDKLIADLDHPSGKRREAASAALAQLRPDVDKRLADEMAKRPSFEKYDRLRRLLAIPARQGQLSEVDTRRLFRALLALELIADKAIPLLRNVAANHFAPAIRAEAATVLGRLTAQ